MTHEVDIYDFLKDYTDKKIVYITNPGNGGDALIAKGTFKVFDELKLSYEIASHIDKFSNKIIFYAGGGNLIGSTMNGKKLGMSCHKFIKNNIENNEIIILPHTITNEDKLLPSLSDNIKFICRERISYDYVYGQVSHPQNVFLAKDMALHLDDLDLYRNKKPTLGTLNAFRRDKESNRRSRSLPSDNIDLSNKLTDNRWWKENDPIVLDNVCHRIFDTVSKYNLVKTDRLHVAIACALIDVEVELHTNFYYKCKAVYDYSLHDYSCVTLKTET